LLWDKYRHCRAGDVAGRDRLRQNLIELGRQRWIDA
jgi:hypothetical protein